MDLLDEVTSVVDRMVDAEPSAFADADNLMTLHEQWTRMGAVLIQAIAGFDTWGDYVNDGAKNAAAWLSKKCNEPVKESRRRVKHGRLLRDMPSLAKAFTAGQINCSHLDLFAGARNSRTKETMARDEALLVEQAANLDFSVFARSLAHWKQLADPDGAEEDAMAQRERRDAYLEPTIGGMFLGKLTLDPISGTILYDELKRIEQELFDADWAEAKERLGYEPKVADLSRTPSQRRADVFVEMAVRSRTAPANGRRPEPRFSILVGYEELYGRICELENGIVVTPGTVYEWLDRAFFERVVFQPDGRVEVSETARFFTGATRRALEIRDRRCTHPFCDEPVERCQGDHVIEYAQGGLTNQANGRLLCAFHNRLRNQRPPPDD